MSNNTVIRVLALHRANLASNFGILYSSRALQGVIPKNRARSTPLALLDIPTTFHKKYGYPAIQPYQEHLSL